MFSAESRCNYTKNQLGEVICQLRFPDILTIGAGAPVEFQEAIRGDYPRYSAIKEPQMVRSGTAQTPAQISLNHQFVSADGLWRINLTSKFISLACSSYTRWEEFAARLDKPLAAFIRIYQPAWLDRVGLRYLNFFSRKALDLEGTPWKELITPVYLGILSDEEILEQTTSQCTQDADIALRGGCRAKIHAGPGMIRRGNQQDPELKYILDLDLYMPGKLAVNLSAGALQTLHAQSWPLFRFAITDTLHNSMKPQ